MKKLLVLILVLVLTHVANAITFKISVNGVVDPEDSTISVYPGDRLVLDIYCDSGYNSIEDSTYVAIVVDTAYGTITGGMCFIPPAPIWSRMEGQSAAGDCYPGLLHGEDGPYASIDSPPVSIWYSPGVYVGDFIFHCVAEGDAIIRLVTTDGDFEVGTEVDRVTIHQVAEPECLIGGNAGPNEYNDWVAWGEPNCWCYCRQCRGDVDGKKTGTKWVALSDLILFSAAYDKTDAVLKTIPNGICCDLDHKKTGAKRVALSDLTIFITYYTSKAPVPPCDQPPIITGPYNSWCGPTGCPYTCP